uniref:Uncharacterized protein n=1 Tax=Acrobeloides nanus TaxID=290746 RepID=A0A914CV80_9BILA
MDKFLVILSLSLLMTLVPCDGEVKTKLCGNTLVKKVMRTCDYCVVEEFSRSSGLGNICCKEGCTMKQLKSVCCQDNLK